MAILTGRLTIVASNNADLDKSALVNEINRTIKPAEPATIDSVHIGVLLAASNQINAQGGCFGLEELTQLARLIVDAPVLVGHRKDDLPIGRVFKGEIIDKDGAPWLRAFFYWHRNQTRADEIKIGIDAGIYRECSLGFLYAKPECGLCRGDMRHCRHRVNEVVRIGGREIKAFYYYKCIERVLEVSLVYRGAVAGTSVSTLKIDTENSNEVVSSKLSEDNCENSFQLICDNANNAYLILRLSGNSNCLRLVAINQGRHTEARSLFVQSPGLQHAPIKAQRKLHLLDQGKLAVSRTGADSLQFYGQMLNGIFKILLKGDSR